VAAGSQVARRQPHLSCRRPAATRRYFAWWWVTIIAVAFTVWYEPYVMAFSAYPGLK
jgi:uncharacterized membrane protein